MWLWLVTSALADPVIDALQAELDRTMAELALPDAEGPYHVSMLVYDTHSVQIQAQLGGLVRREEGPDRSLSVGVRVGDETADNSNYDTWRDGWGARGLVLGDDPLAVRHDAWLLLDDQYKEAVEALAAKEAALRRKAEADDVPDFAPGAPQQAEAPATPPSDPEALEALARELSAVFLEHPDVEWSMVWAGSETGRRAMLDTGGTRVLAPLDELGVRVVARARAEDGATAVDQVLYVGRATAGVPSAELLKADVLAMCERLEAWRTLPTTDAEYVGPVLFEDAAAIDLFRHVLLPALQGTPPKEKPPRGSRVVVWDDEEASAGAMRVRRRILPSGWDVVDDPEADPSSPASYAYDWEGEPARRVELVDDGVVKTHLSTRTPSKAVPQSNGHARGFGGQLPRAMPAIATVTPPRALSDRKLHKQAIRLAADYGLDHYVRVRRLTDPATDGMDGGPLVSARSFFGFEGERTGLPAPIQVVRVYADGREEPLRGLSITGVDARSLKEIVAAGASSTRTVLMMPPEAGGAGPLQGFPVTVTGPAVLLGEAELAPAGGSVERPPLLASPLAE